MQGIQLSMKGNIAVIGAGITGITTAYYLAKAGYTVSVYERESGPAQKTSFANGGQISVSNSEVWTTWSNVLKGIKWLGQKDAPLLIRRDTLISDPDRISWLIKFLYYTATNSYYRNTVETIRMGLESKLLYNKIMNDEYIKFDYSKSGILHFYKDKRYFKAAIKAKDIYESNSLGWNILEPKQVKSLDPALEDIDDIIGGAWTPSDFTGDIYKFCVELEKILKEKYQVNFYYNHNIEKVLIDGYDRIVITGGVGSVKLAQSIGDDLPIYPVKGYSITINNVDPKYLPKVSLLDDQAKIVTSSLGNRFRVAGTAELAGENYDIRPDRIEPLLNWVRVNFPKIDIGDYSSWACLRPMTPNMLPITKKSDKNSKVYYNTGHGHLGWTLAPYTAEKIVNLIQKDK
jgi:D-amino-acid dehydrogenase